MQIDSTRSSFAPIARAIVATNLGHFQCVCEPGAVVISFIINEHLCFVFKATESGRVKDAIAVTLETGTIVRFTFFVFPAF